LQAAGGARMQGWVTSQDRKLEEVKLGEWRPFSGDNANGVVIDTTKRYQEVLGFGAAFTDASC
jgi:glucosylceramidase